MTISKKKKWVAFDEEHRGQAAMTALAKHLADNHFDVTFGFPRKTASFFKDYRKVFKEKQRDFVETPRVRNVVIVGAGVSYAAFGGELFPLAYDAIDELRERLGVRGLRDALGHSDGTVGEVPDRLAEEEEIFRQLYGVKDPRHDFESQLAILSKFYTPRQIRGVLGTIYRPRYYPHIVFETIAHLLKHRFIEAVINYNFDEVLDQAIEEEVRGGDYQYVISDGDCVDLTKLVVDDTLKVPLYIKPHGTISHKSTLRFTKDAYVGMPSDLLAFTKKILMGHTRENPQLQPDRFRVNLISIGFAFTSVELTEMLRGHTRLKVFHINLENESNERLLWDNVAALGNGIEQYLIGVKPGVRGTAGRREAWPSIADAVGDLFERTVDRFEEMYRPRHLARHLFVHSLLFREGDRRMLNRTRRNPRPVPFGSGLRVPVSDRHYHYARLCVELALAVAKGNGRIDLATLVDDRVGIYFREWRQLEPGGGMSLRAICEERFGLEDDEGFAGNVFTIPGLSAVGIQDVSETEMVELAAIDDEEKFISGTAAFAFKIWKLLKGALLHIDDALFKQHIRERDSQQSRRVTIILLARLVHSDLQELAPRFSMDALLLLNRTEPKSVIHTPLGMMARFMSMVEDPRWDLMLAITEQGKILGKLAPEHWRKDVPTDRGVHTICRRASIVVADPPYPRLEHRLEEFRERKLLIGDDYRLPYWAHNDHLIVVLRMCVNPGDFEPLAAISYRRSGLRNRVNPVYINDPDDLELLVRMYFGYVAKSEYYMLNESREPASLTKRSTARGGVPDVNCEHAMSVRRRLTAKWWDEMIQERQYRTSTQVEGESESKSCQRTY